VEGLPTLAGGGTDKNDIAAAALPLHLCDRVLYEAEHAFEIDRHGPAPVRI